MENPSKSISDDVPSIHRSREICHSGLFCITLTMDLQHYILITLQILEISSEVCPYAQSVGPEVEIWDTELNLTIKNYIRGFSRKTHY